MEFTIKSLATKINVAEGTIRSWTMKPEQGKTYSSENINYTNLFEKLHKYYPNEENFEKLAGCKVDDIKIVKTERVTRTYVKVEDLSEGEFYVIHNYSLKTRMLYEGEFEVPGVKLQIFKVVGKDDYKAYTTEQLSQENIKIEQV